MRLYIHIDDALIARVDEIAGPGARSEFVRQAVRKAVESRRWDLIERAAGAASERPHEWDANPAAWVRRQRRAVPRSDAV
ncbi:MAG: hypothetical protein OXP70_09230 [Acidobacteriota bacterium]|nr:hypothetical protein [Acidobacteriota bacterium]